MVLQRCGIQYVGGTGQALHETMNRHQSDTTGRLEDSPVVQHFSSSGHSLDDISVMVIEK